MRLQQGEECLDRQAALSHDAPERTALEVAGVHGHGHAQCGLAGVLEDEMASGLVVPDEVGAQEGRDHLAGSEDREAVAQGQVASETCSRSLRGGTLTSGGNGSPSATRLSQ